MTVVWTVVFVLIVGWFFVCVVAYVGALLALSWKGFRKGDWEARQAGERPRLLGRWRLK